MRFLLVATLSVATTSLSTQAHAQAACGSLWMRETLHRRIVDTGSSILTQKYVESLRHTSVPTTRVRYDHNFEKAWEEWRTALSPSGRSASKDSMEILQSTAERVARLNNLTKLVSMSLHEQLPNGERFSDVLNARELLTPERYASLTYATQRRIDQMKLMLEEIRLVEIEMKAAIVDTLADRHLNSREELRSARRRYISLVHGAIERNRAEVDQMKEHLEFTREIVNTGENAFRAYLNRVMGR